MDDTRRQLLTAALAAALVGGGFMAFEYFRSEPAPDEVAEEAEAENPDEEASAPADARPNRGRAQDRHRHERKLRIRTENFEAVFTNLNTGLVSFRLLGERFAQEDGQPQEMVTTDHEPYLPLALDLRGIGVPEDAVWEGKRLSPTSIRFTWAGKGFRVVRKVEAGDGPYQLWSTLVVTNESAGTRPVRPVVTAHHYVSKEAEGGGFLFARPSPERSLGSCHYDGETERKDGEELQEPHGYGPEVHWTGVENVYFATLLAPSQGVAHRCHMESSLRGGTVDDPHGTLFSAHLVYDRTKLAPGESKTWRTIAYVGPKEHDWLAAAGHQLTEAVDLGWFDWIGEWLVALLRWIHGLVSNWGLAIILLTVLVKLVLYPLTEKSFQSMAKMRQLKPEMDRINELYADDREKKGMAIMELYRKHKINPLGGCLPTLLQLPIWFALYQSLSTNVELYHAPFALWWQDLSSPDPYYVLPLTLGLLMFAQQKLTPTTMDATQAKVMMYFMPVMITVFMLFLPAGLCLYMVTNSTLGIGQQRWIQWRLENAEPEEQAEQAPAEEPSDSDTQPDKAASKPKTTSKTAKSTSRAKGRGGKRRQRRGRA
ncbi:MAG: membrane protein insertase YidC [Myxococcota bacterium]